jgi:hypothetical protein
VNYYSKYKDPDRYAPRFRTPRFLFVNEDLHKKFLEANPKYHIEYQDFRFIIEQINLEFINLAIENREGVILPKGLGRIWLGLFPPKRKELRETGLKKFNFHSGSMQGKINWDYDFVKYKIENHDFYGFLAHREFKHKASRAFTLMPEQYVRIDGLVRAYEASKKRKLEQNELCRSDDQDSNKSGESTE